MTVFVRFSSLLTMSVFCCSMAFSQTQQPVYTRHVCVKVKDGKRAEFAAYLPERLKEAKVRVDSGALKSYAVAESVSPRGSSTRCDYHFFYAYDGFPPELGLGQASPANIAGDRLYSIESIDTWRREDGTNPVGAKGQYHRLNFTKVNAGKVGEWLRLQSTGWKPMAEIAAKQLGTGWVAGTLVMPGGSALPYNAMTVDIFPNWAAVGKGIPSRTFWNQVHPRSDLTAYFDDVAAIAVKTEVHLVKIVDRISK